MPSPKPSGTEAIGLQERARPAPYAWGLRSRSVAETRRIGRLVGQALRGGEILALYGELGTGKTALVSGIAAGLEAPPHSVSSPTFVFIHHYRGRLPLAHADLYRIESFAEVRNLGLSDCLDGRTVLAIEWAEKAGTELPHDRLEVRLNHKGKTSREILFESRGPASADLLAQMKRLHQSAPRGGVGASGRRLRSTG